MSINPKPLPDIFKSVEAREILYNKYVLFVGDSVIRGMYKDLVKLLQTNEHLTSSQLKDKGEHYFENDLLLQGGRIGPKMSNDTTYREIREYRTGIHFIRFYFITRCYSDYLMSICADIKNLNIKPDVVIMNSGCWDLTRYGMNSMRDYKQNLPRGLFSLLSILPDTCTFMWTTTMPLSKNVRGGFMVPEVENMRGRLRNDVLQANKYACIVARKLNIDILDLQYYFHNHTKHRASDGIHWDAATHRCISNLILNHLSMVWRIDTPSREVIKRDPTIVEPCGEDLEEEEDLTENQSNNYSENNDLEYLISNNLNEFSNNDSVNINQTKNEINVFQQPSYNGLNEANRNSLHGNIREVDEPKPKRMSYPIRAQNTSTINPSLFMHQPILGAIFSQNANLFNQANAQPDFEKQKIHLLHSYLYRLQQIQLQEQTVESTDTSQSNISNLNMVNNNPAPSVLPLMSIDVSPNPVISNLIPNDRKRKRI